MLRERPADIPYGHCWCGCGEKTNLAKGTCTTRGRVKGQPYRFINGHGARVQAPQGPSHEIDAAGDVRMPLRARDGTIRAYAIVDARDVGLAIHRWHLSNDEYAHRRTSRTDGKRVVLALHREVLGLVPGDGLEGDHINLRNRLDCRRSNLRIAKHHENMQNLASRRGSASTYRGVSFNKETKRWKARCMLHGKEHHLGYFDSEVEAAKAASDWRAAHMPFSVEAAA